ncbi:MAG: protein phosphatase 2C domain-containing protein, partial [Planctomycetales bacterium]
ALAGTVGTNMDGMANQLRTFYQADMPEQAVHSLAGGAAVVFSVRGPGKEAVNEDAAALIPVGDRSAVLVVADGLGGHTAGEEASRLAVEKIHQAVSAVGAPNQGSGLRTAILNGIEDANRAVLALSCDAATTVAVAEIQERSVRSYHVGDSLVLLVGNRGRIKLQTLSHSPVGYAVESGILDEEAAMHHNDRHLVSNFVGDPEMRIEIGPVIEMSPRDTLLLASDGLVDNLHVNEIVDRIRKGKLAKAAKEMSKQALKRMQSPGNGHPSKPDDLTFIAYRSARYA